MYLFRDERKSILVTAWHFLGQPGRWCVYGAYVTLRMSCTQV